ncbi:hypothetical protein BT69DRAFT_433002 [Atractiella rhizophila]|nr:hypothetical protein BT69DRAFT_433002 [Atractiella rhizophila]
MRLFAFLTPSFHVPSDRGGTPPLLLQDVSKGPHALCKSLVTSAQFKPTRKTDKFIKVSYYDHLRKDLEVLPLNVTVPFWPDILVHGDVQPETCLSSFLLDLKNFLTYMYPARASAPLSIHISHQMCSSHGVRTQEIDVLRIQMEEEVLAVLVVLVDPRHTARGRLERCHVFIDRL